MNKKLSNPEIIRGHIDNFLATGQTVENIRDIWYQFKHDIEHLKPLSKKDGDWDSYVNDIIGAYLYKIYLEDDMNVYKNLNIMTRGLSNTGYTNNTPIVLFSEKRTRAIDNAAEALLCGRYDSIGQIPSFEAANIAEYLFEKRIGNETYLIALTDYDPAGLSIFNSLCNKLEDILYALDPDIYVTPVLVPYGDNYEEIITNYDSYTLSTNPKNKINQAWIRGGKVQGVELNVFHDKQERLEATILKHINPEVMEHISEERERTRTFNNMLREDEKHLKLQKKLEKREAKIRAKVDDMEADFDTTWATSLSWDNVRKMTILKRN